MEFTQLLEENIGKYVAFTVGNKRSVSTTNELIKYVFVTENTIYIDTENGSHTYTDWKDIYTDDGISYFIDDNTIISFKEVA